MTTANQSSLLNIFNDEAEDIDWGVRSISVTSTASTGGSDQWLVGFVKNATSGTLITAGTDVDANNLNLGSNRPLSVIAKEGVEGSTLTGGTTSVDIMIPLSPGALAADPEVVVVPQGTSLGINVTPQAGNTSVNITVSITLYRIVGEE